MKLFCPPFKPSEHRRIAVKVIDFRDNEVVRVMEVATDPNYEREYR